MIRHHAEDDASDGPSDEKNGKDQAAIPADVFIGHCTGCHTACQKIVQRGMQNDGVDRGIHGIEDPAEPGDEQDQPLIPSNAVAP